jgi:hypothetical protein
MFALPSDAVASAVYFTRYLDTTKDIVVTFDFACYGPNSAGSEGFCLFFSDSTLDTVRYGGPGPGLCYSGVSGVKADTQVGFTGLQGGIIGVGFDITGNFGSNAFFSTGHDDGTPNTITVRGMQVTGVPATSGYQFITRSNNINTYNFKYPLNLYDQITDDSLPNFKRARIRITDFGQRLVVDLKNLTDTEYTTCLNCDLSNYITWPISVRAGLTFTTGLLTDTIFKIRNFNVNGVFSNVYTGSLNTYTYVTDSKTLNGSYVQYSVPSNVMSVGDLLSSINVNTSDPRYLPPNNPIIIVDQPAGPAGVPYYSGDGIVNIDYI